MIQTSMITRRRSELCLCGLSALYCTRDTVSFFLAHVIPCKRATETVYERASNVDKCKA